MGRPLQQNTSVFCSQQQNVPPFAAGGMQMPQSCKLSSSYVAGENYYNDDGYDDDYSYEGDDENNYNTYEENGGVDDDNDDYYAWLEEERLRRRRESRRRYRHRKQARLVTAEAAVLTLTASLQALIDQKQAANCRFQPHQTSPKQQQLAALPAPPPPLPTVWAPATSYTAPQMPPPPAVWAPAYQTAPQHFW